MCLIRYSIFGAIVKFFRTRNSLRNRTKKIKMRTNKKTIVILFEVFVSCCVQRWLRLFGTGMCVQQTTSSSSRLLLFYPNRTIAWHTLTQCIQSTPQLHWHTHTTHAEIDFYWEIFFTRSGDGDKSAAGDKTKDDIEQRCKASDVENSRTQREQQKCHRTRNRMCAHGGCTIISRQQNQTNAFRIHRRHNEKYRISKRFTSSCSKHVPSVRLFDIFFFVFFILPFSLHNSFWRYTTHAVSHIVHRVVLLIHVAHRRLVMRHPLNSIQHTKSKLGFVIKNMVLRVSLLCSSHIRTTKPLSRSSTQSNACPPDGSGADGGENVEMR